jgi:DNA topoisomerase-1
MDLKFTSHMEEELDEIEERKMKRNDVLQEFYDAFRQALDAAEAKLELDAEKCPECGRPLVERRSKFGKFFGCSGHPECKYIKRSNDREPRQPPKPTEYKCPECGSPMVERMGKRGPFLGCSTYPKCKMTMNLDAEGKPIVTSKPTEHLCEKCGKPMRLRESPRGPFLGCTGYPKCRNLVNVDAEGNPIKPLETGETCAKCGSAMQVKFGPRGPFLGCSAYPKCRSTKQMTAEMKEKFKDQLPVMPARKKEPKVVVEDTCPECGAPMELRRGRKGYFLGCTKFSRTKCKGTREASPEILEQVQSAVSS